MKQHRWRWAVIALALIAAVAVPLALIPGGDDATSSDDPPAEATPAGEVAPAPVNDPGVKITEEGAVRLEGVRTSRPSPDALVVSYRTDVPVSATLRAFDRGGSPLGVVSGARPEGENVEVVPLVRSADNRLRFVLAVAPASSGAPTIASVAVPPLTSSVSVVSPTSGSSIEGGRVVVRLRTRNFDISNQGGPLQGRQGHVHLTLDGRTYIVVYGTSFTFRDVPPGDHRLIVTPARNDHMPAPGVEESVIQFSTTA